MQRFFRQDHCLFVDWTPHLKNMSIIFLNVYIVHTNDHCIPWMSYFFCMEHISRIFGYFKSSSGEDKHIEGKNR